MGQMAGGWLAIGRAALRALTIEIYISKLFFMDMKSSVKSADRALDLFEAFSDMKRPLSLSELADCINTPASSCHGLVRTLRQRGYLYDVGRRLLYPTRRILDVARAIVENDPVLERIEPALQRLRDGSRETIILGARQNDAVVYLAVVEGQHTIRYTARPGEHKPLHSSAIGKALLGTLDDGALEQLVAKIALPAVTDNTLTDPAALAADIRDGREKGFFVTRGENVADVMAVATTATLNNVPYGIAIAGPVHRMEPLVDDYGAQLLKARDNIAATGWPK
jgi:DNA-binding IclR family transcriptional regulator